MKGWLVILVGAICLEACQPRYLGSGTSRRRGGGQNTDPLQLPDRISDPVDPYDYSYSYGDPHYEYSDRETNIGKTEVVHGLPPTITPELQPTGSYSSDEHEYDVYDYSYSYGDLTYGFEHPSGIVNSEASRRPKRTSIPAVSTRMPPVQSAQDDNFEPSDIEDDNYDYSYSYGDPRFILDPGLLGDSDTDETSHATEDGDADNEDGPNRDEGNNGEVPQGGAEIPADDEGFTSWLRKRWHKSIVDVMRTVDSTRNHLLALLETADKYIDKTEGVIQNELDKAAKAVNRMTDNTEELLAKGLIRILKKLKTGNQKVKELFTLIGRKVKGWPGAQPILKVTEGPRATTANLLQIFQEDEEIQQKLKILLQDGDLTQEDLQSVLDAEPSTSSPLFLR